ncbi:MAG: phosphoribosylanthranilate isomerase [Betaproteobacteria bacterium]|nr:MAG: phosphoribosylanthranilate isomerase [Betaproteobacteria bacterium]
MRTRIKICGITRAADARVACLAGADALGFVFFAPSPRNVAPEVVREILGSLPPFVTSVGLFVDPDPEFVRRTLAVARVDLLQFHGDESPQFCGSFGVPFIKAVRMRPEVDLLEYARRFRSARGLLLDTYVSGIQGGTGIRFDWGLIPADFPLPIVLSGGLDPDNVAEAVRQARPWAVDVSSGVEAAKGVKDPQRILDFIAGVRDADA